MPKLTHRFFCRNFPAEFFYRTGANFAIFNNNFRSFINFIVLLLTPLKSPKKNHLVSLDYFFLSAGIDYHRNCASPHCLYG